jgi:lactoylglutathione lyase
MRRICLILVIVCCFFARPATAQVKAHINHVAIYIVDLAKTKSFYENVIGLDTIPEPFHDGKHAWYKIGPGIALHVIQGADQPKEYFLNNHICFSVSNTPAFVEKLKAKGVTYYNSKGVAGQITDRVDGVKQVWVKDPDGYYLEINDAKD